MVTIFCMYLQNYFCTLRVFDGQVFLETDILEFLLNIAYRKCRTIGTKVDIKQYKECGYISNIY